jgi:hypothetical protein
MLLHVALLAGSRVNLVIFLQSAACLRKFISRIHHGHDVHFCFPDPLIKHLHSLGIDLSLHQQGLDTTTPSAMFQMLGLFAEFERAMSQERARAGLATAKAERSRLVARRSQRHYRSRKDDEAAKLSGQNQRAPLGKSLGILSELRRRCRPAFHGLARGTIVGALGDTQTPAIPIRWPGSFDVHRTGPTYRPSSTFAHHILGSCLIFYRRRGFACPIMNDATPKQIAAAKATVTRGNHIWT